MVMNLIQKNEARKSLRRPAFLSEYVQKYTNSESQANYEISVITPFGDAIISDGDKHKTKKPSSKVHHPDECEVTDLQQVLRDGDREEIRQALGCLDQGPWSEINKVNGEDLLGPLHLAARRCNSFATEQLLQHGADINLVGEDGKHAIHYAAKHYKQTIDHKFSTSGKSCLQVLLHNGANVNAKDIYLSTPLHYASDRGHFNAVQILIETGKADLQARDDHLSTPLHEAAKRGHVEIMSAILENTNQQQRSKLLEAKDENGCTPLILACRDGFTQAAEVLLNYAGKTNADAPLARLIDQDNELTTPLHAAIDNGSIETVYYLLDVWEKQAALIQNSYDGTSKPEFSSYVDMKCSHGKTALHSAAECGVIEIVQAVLSYGSADVNARNNSKATSLWIASHRNHLEVTKLLLDRSANCEIRNNEGLTPLMVACRDGHVEIVRLLLVHGADASIMDARDRNCCLLAAEHGRTQVVQVLMSLSYAKSLLQGCDRHGNSPMHVAAAQGKMNIVKIFMSEGASLGQRNDSEQTPLHVAALYGQLKVVQEIVHADRSSLNDQDENSRTALHLAALNGHTSTLQGLLLLGANTRDKDSKGRTALDICVNAGWTESAKVLLDANPSLVDNKARDLTTPLHTACEKGNANLVRLLLNRKADVKMCLPDGRNALDIAIDNYNEDCAKILLEDDSWRHSLRNAYQECASETIVTPLRKLVERMPNVAELALTKCMTTNDVRCDDKMYMITFNYEFLDDAYEATRWIQTVSNPDGSKTSDAHLKSDSLEMKYIIPTTENWRQLRNETINAQDWKLEKSAKPYSKSGSIVSENHILNKMVKSKSERILRHPTVSSLLNLKWSMFGRYIYWINVLTYLIFFVSLNVYMTTTPPRFAVNITGTEQQVSAGNKCLTIVTQAQDVWGSDCQGPSASRYVFITLVLAFSSIQLIKEIFQMIHQRLKYFLDLTNYIETTLYILCILVFIDIDPLANDTGIREKWQWECGAFAVLISWLNLLLYARRTAWLGIYVFMVTSVGFTFLRFAAVLVLFVLGFSFSFYVLLQNQYPFYTPALACVKTFVMMIGEMDYTSIFLTHYTSSEYHDVVQYDISTNVVFIIFAVFMSLLLTNLLVGLAVDDIASVQDHALVQRLALQVEGLLDMEYAMPEILRRRWVVRERRVFPNKYEGRNSILRWLVEEREIKEKHIRATIAPPDSETDKLRTEVKALRNDLSHASEAIKLISKQQLEFTQLIDNLSINVKTLVDKSSG